VTDPTPYLHLPGTAREALTFYGEVFGCAVQLHTFAEFNRTDGPADAIAHGYLTEGRSLSSPPTWRETSLRSAAKE
jgi:PhnB protein